jgi:hypothetical protein
MVELFGEDGPESEFDKHEGDDRWLNEGEATYEDILDAMTDQFGSNIMDEYAADLMFDGWFNPEVDAVSRAEIWYEFFEYTGLQYDDFDWFDWREWYES